MKTASLLIILALSSCSGVYSGLTGQPIPSTKIKRVEGPATAPELNVATQDLARAEAYPDTVYGLYDAGRLAKRVGELQASSK